MTSGTILPVFDGLRGHQKSLSYLSALLSGGNLPSALLLHGPAGVGKRSAALRVARFLNCNGDQTAACPCGACLRIASGEHLDVLCHDPGAGEAFKIDAVREVLAQADVRRMEGRYRVLILDRVENMADRSADALLKTVEDGRQDTLFVLLAQSKARVLPTLASRCLDLYFPPLPKGELCHLLQTAFPDADEAARDVAASLSQGMDDATFYLKGPGIGLRAKALALLRAYPKQKDYAILNAIRELGEDDLVPFAYLALTLLGDALQFSLIPGGGSGIVNADLSRELADMAGAIPATRLAQGQALLGDVYHRISGNGSLSTHHHVKSAFLTLKEILRA